MKINRVLDTSALMAVFRDEPGADKVAVSLLAGGCVMHVANMSEFYSAVPRKSTGLFTPVEAMAWVDRNGIDGIDWMDRPFALLAAEVRVAVPALSLGDGLAVALASVLDVPLLVAERAFKKAAGFATIELLR